MEDKKALQLKELLFCCPLNFSAVTHMATVGLMHCVQKVMSIHKLRNVVFFFFEVWATACYVSEINSDTGFLDHVRLAASI